MAKGWVLIIGNVLIVIGVGMWGVYAVGRYLLGWDITDRQFLPYHLAVIIPGMAIRFYYPRLRQFFSKHSHRIDNSGDH